MPKLIPELENRIIRTAKELFIRDGFDAVSMRRLASELEIAVGTLYNYFPDKTALFFSIMEKSWKETFTELDTIISSEENRSSDTRRKAIGTIYDGIRGRGGFAMKTFGTEKPGMKIRKPDNLSSFHHDKLIKELIKRLKPLGAGFEGPQAERLTQTLVASIRFFIFTTKSTEREQDIEFLLNLVELQKGTSD